MPTYDRVDPNEVRFEELDVLLPPLTFFTLELDLELDALRRSMIFSVLLSSDLTLLSSV